MTIVLTNDNTNLKIGISYDNGYSNTQIYSGTCAAHLFANCAAVTRVLYGGANSGATLTNWFDLVGWR